MKNYSIVPNITNSKSLGTSSKIWSNAYIQDLSINNNIEISGNTIINGVLQAPNIYTNALQVSGNATISGSTLYVPSSFTIDPIGYGDNTGTLLINGNLVVQGLTTTINSSVVDISDKMLVLASNASNPIQADGAGFEISGAKVNFLYNNSSASFRSSIGISISGNVVPVTNSVGSLGESGKIWDIAYIRELNVTNFTNSIDGAKIASETITSSQIMNGTILGTDISNDTITSANIRDGSILTGDICDNAITFDKLAYNSVGNTQIINGAVTHEKLSGNCIQSHNIVDGTIVDSDISGNANILGSKLANNSITSDKINQANNWTFSQLTSTTANIRDISTTNIEVSGNIVPLNANISTLGTALKPWNNAYIRDVSTTNIEVSGNIVPLRDMSSNLGSSLKRWNNVFVNDLIVNTINGQAYIGLITNSINTTHIQDGSILGTDISSGTISSTQIADGTIMDVDISTNAAIAFSKINASFAITNSHISASAAISGAKIASGTISATQIANTTITAAQIANTTITAAQIANTTITASQIANNTITSSQIANNTITASQIANTTITAAQIANTTITAAQIANASITSDKINQTNNWTFSQLTANNLTINTINGAAYSAGGGSTVLTSVTSDILPSTTNIYNIGSATNVWNTGVFTNILINGNGAINTNATNPVIFSNASFRPSTSGVGDLGGSSNRYRFLHVNQIVLWVGMTPDVDNTIFIGSSTRRYATIFTVDLTVNTTGYASDDRVKHNEVIINNGLDIIDLLTPKFYQKTIDILDASYNGDLSGHKWTYESGLIAQELLQIKDLSFVVSGGDYYDTSNNLIKQTYNVNYNSVFVYGLAAIKELHQKVKVQETSISSLQTAMLEQQATINSLLTRLQALETGAN